MTRTASWRPCVHAALLMLFAATTAEAAVVTVLTDSGPGSLRTAVAAGGDVTFASGLAGTITLTTGQMVVPPGTTINGPSFGEITVDAGNSGRVFDITSASTSTVSISGLKLTGGKVGTGDRGGAIRNAGVLVLGGMEITNSTAGDAGGAIYNSGTLYVLGSLLTGNAVIDANCAGGGAIRSEGAGAAFMVKNSTITQNSAASCNGGGISVSGGTPEIIASTIVGNSAGLGGGNIYKGSAATLLTLNSSVIAGGSSGGSIPVNADLHGAFGGGLASVGRNLVQARGDGVGYLPSDLADGTDPQLDALAIHDPHGGPLRTIGFAWSSPLRDAIAVPCATDFDQRGVQRPQGASCDIGAFEYRTNRLDISVTGTGTVSAGPTPVPRAGSVSNCSTNCSADYDGETGALMTVHLVATPGPNQLFSGWGGDCAFAGAAPVDLPMDIPHTCTATFVPNTYTVTPSVSGGNGSISPATQQTVTAGDTTSFTLSPGANYHVANVGGSCGGTLSGPNNTIYTTNAINGDCTVVASFAIDQHLVTASVVGNGSIAPSGPTPVNHGSAISFQLMPASNHHVDSVGGTCGGTLSGPNNTIYTTAAITTDCAVIAHFAIDQHAVTPSVAGGHGAINPATVQTVDHGATTQFTLLPDANYHVASVDGTCGGVLSGPNNTIYTTNAVNVDCSVVAHFTIDRLTVTPSVAGGHGSISPATAQQVDHGATLQFTLAPDPNYHVASVDGTCTGVLSGTNNTTYTTNAITADCTVVAHFAIDQHAVTPSVDGGHGSIDPSTVQNVDHGLTTQFTLTPDANYHVATVDGSCGGALSGPNNTIYTTSAVTADCTVVAHFAIDQHAVTPGVVGGHGSIDPSTVQNVDHASTTQFTLTPDAHYHVASVEGSCGGTLSGTAYTTAPVTTGCTVDAHFAIDTHTIGGNVTGLIGSGLVLRLNGGNDLLVTTSTFVFAQPLDDLSAYSVTIAQQPVAPAQICSVGNGSGTLDGADVTSVVVSCLPPQPHLSVTVTDARDYARYGMLLNYVVNVTNDGTGDASGVSLHNVLPAQLDGPASRWICLGAGGGATCAASGTGALADTNVSIPIGRTLTWLISAPVRVDAPGAAVDYQVDVSGPNSTSAMDRDLLVIMRTGFDVHYDDGAQSAVDGTECETVQADPRLLDAATTITFDLPALTGNGPLDVVLRGQSASGASFRVERLVLDESVRLRLVVAGRDGVERASAWAMTNAPTSLVLGIATTAEASSLLLEGASVPLDIALPQGAGVSFHAGAQGTVCQ